MASDEDYLDNLLNSISQKKSDVEKESAEEKRKTAEKIAQENDIKPEDDFLKASGLDTYTEKPVERKNLKKAFSEEDFLKEFESELADGSADKFVEEFDRELGEENNDSSPSLHVTEGSRNISIHDENDNEKINPDSSGDDYIYNDLPNTKSAPSISDSAPAEGATEFDTISEADVLNNIDNIVKNAKSGDVSDDLSDFSNIELPDDFDLNDTSAKDVKLMDENAEDSSQDLDALLDGSNEFGDLGDMLSADQNSEELPEARDEFEQSAESLEKAAEDPFADLQNDDASISDLEGDGSKKQGGFFSKLLSNIKNIFSKSDETTEPEKGDKDSDDSGIVDIAPKNPTTDELLKEDQKILSEFGDSESDTPSLDGAPDSASSDEEQKEGPEKKKKEKKKKEKKEKPKKQPKPKKVKAPKPPDNSPKIPTAAIGVNAVLAVSIVLLVLIFSNAVSHRNSLAAAKADYNAGNYHEAYVAFSSLKLSENDAPYLRKSKIMSSLSISYEEYKTCMDAKKYDIALDALVKGVHYYHVNKPAATELQIDDIYDNMENTIVSELSDKFGLSSDDAENLYGMKSRVSYTASINEILLQKGYTNGETQ